MCLDLVQPNKYIIVLRLHTQKNKHHCLLAAFEAWRACFRKESMVSQDCLWSLPSHLRQNTLTLHSLDVSLDTHALRVRWNSVLLWRCYITHERGNNNVRYTYWMDHRCPTGSHQTQIQAENHQSFQDGNSRTFSQAWTLPSHTLLDLIDWFLLLKDELMA